MTPGTLACSVQLHYSPYSEVNYNAADGHQFYEGQAPKGGLHYMAPIGQHSFNVVLFEVKSEQ
jgi:hypothetical protein